MNDLIFFFEGNCLTVSDQSLELFNSALYLARAWAIKHKSNEPYMHTVMIAGQIAKKANMFNLSIMETIRTYFSERNIDTCTKIINWAPLNDALIACQ